MNGKFITFEGIEGAGKTTTIDMISNFLQENSLDCIVTREPGGTVIGEKIRDILLDNKSKLDDKSELLLMFAARNQHINEVIKPALKDNKWVICDRYIDASLAYQGYGRGIELNIISNLINTYAEDVMPDITFLLDIDVTSAFLRFEKNREKDRFENLNIDFFEKVRLGYIDIANKNPKRIKVIDAKKNSESIANEIIGEIKKRFDI
tara:strand:- start:45 stop:665 length:621 start_codon:yes stop_codon:yes gene_type:complete